MNTEREEDKANIEPAAPVERLVIFLRCWWFGHEPDCSGQVFNSDTDNSGWCNTPCKRCGIWDIEQHELYTGSRSFKEKQFLVFWLYRRWWPEKCKDCGKRYGEHNDCIPF